MTPAQMYRREQVSLTVGMVTMGLWTFGWAGVAFYLYIIWEPELAVASCAVSWFGGKALARPIAWLVTLGLPPREPVS